MGRRADRNAGLILRAIERKRALVSSWVPPVAIGVGLGTLAGLRLTRPKAGAKDVLPAPLPAPLPVTGREKRRNLKEWRQGRRRVETGLPPAAKARFVAAARGRGLSVSAALRLAIAEWVDRHERRGELT